MEIAQVVAKRSTCFRLNVGCVIVANDRIVSIGYNGALAHEPHCAGNSCPGVQPGMCPTVHAEENAIMYLHAAFRDPDVPKDIYITHMPCSGCANSCVQVGVKRLFYATPYRCIEAIDMLVRQGVEVYQVTPAGYVIRYRDKEVVTL